MALGESPYECAKRESYEELGLELHDDDLNLFGYVSEKNYEGGGHWLMFLLKLFLLFMLFLRQLTRAVLNFFTVLKLTHSKFLKVITSWSGPFTTKEIRAFGVSVQTFDAQSTKIKIEAKPI